MRPLDAGTLRRCTDWALAVIVVAVALACYWPALHGELLWDDPAHITSEDLRSWSGLGQIWFKLGATQQYYPVLHTAFWIEHRLWGDSMFGYHLANVLLHAACCCLLAMLLRRLWSFPAGKPDGAPARPRGLGPEWLAALLFAVHPVCVESVAWISEEKNTLSLLFYLLAGIVYLDFSAGRRWGAYGLATLFFLLALGTKTVTATLPAAILVVLWWRNGRLSWRRDALPLVPWVGAALAGGLVTAWVERTDIGARGATFDLSAVDRVLLASRDVWFYLGKLIWPANLAFFYPRWDVAKDAAHWHGYLLAGLVVTAALFWWRRRARGPLAAWLLFLGALFPALGFFNVYPFIFSYVADHFQYLAAVVFVSAVAGGIAWIAARPLPWARLAAGAGGGALVVGLAFASRGQSRLYRGMEPLFRHTVAAVPQNWMAHHNLGLALRLARDGQSAAIAEFRQAIALNPDFPESHFALGRELAKQPGAQAEAIAEFGRALQLQPYYPEANNALGVELARQNRLAEAFACFEKALLVRPKTADFHLNFANALAKDPARLPEAMAHFAEALHLRPAYAKAHNDYAVVLARLPGHQAEAVVEFEQALRLEPGYAEAQYNLANTLAEMPGRMSEAISHYERALASDPGSAATHFGLANALALQPGRASEALAHYEAALRLHPDFAEAHANLANVLARLPGRLPDALEHYEAALRLNPNLAWVHFNLGLHLAQLPGRADDAMAHYAAALRLKPDYTDALNGLAILYAQQGRWAEARASWRKALEIDPNYRTAQQNLRLLDQMAAQHP